MPLKYVSRAATFQYPDNWTIEQEDSPSGGRSVTVHSPSGAFWSVAIYAQPADPAELARAAVEAMKSEYPGLDFEAADETVAGRDLVGYDMNFFCLDLTNTASVRCLRNEGTSYAIFYQAEDHDYAELGEVFQAITTSLIRELRRLRYEG